MKAGRMITALLLVAAFHTFSFAAKTETYGPKLTLSEVIKISDILASPEEFIGKRVLLSSRSIFCT